MTVKKSAEGNTSEFLYFNDADGNVHTIKDLRAQIEPMSDRIYIEKIFTKMPEQRRVRSIIVYSSQENVTECKYALGKVISVGQDIDKVKVGSIVVIGRWSGVDIVDHADNKYSLIKQEDVIGIVKC